MKRFNFHRGRRFLFVAGCLLCGVSVCRAAIFAKFEGVEGESKVSGHEGWMLVEGVGSKVSSESGIVDGRPRFSPKAEAFVLRKRIDKASPYLLEALLKGTVFDEVQLEQTSAGGLVACYRMRGVRLTDRQVRTEAGKDLPAEELGFDFDVIEWHYFEDAEDPNSLGHVGTTWDFATGVGGSVEQHGGEAPSIAPISPTQVQPGTNVFLAIQLIDPSGDPDKLVLSAQPSEKGLVKVTGFDGQGLLRGVGLEISPLLNGSDRVTLSVSDGERSSTRVLPIIIAGDRTPYEAYMDGFLGEQIKLEPEMVGLLRDPDKDKLTNFMEFYLGTNPGEYTRSNEAMSFEQVKSEDGIELRMKYFRRADTVGLSEGFEGTRDFANWLTLGPKTEPRLEVKVLPSGDGTYVPVEATVFVDEVADPSFFLRLSVEGTY